MATTTMSLILRPLCISTTSTILSKYPVRKSTFSSITTSPLFFSRSLFCSSLITHSPTKAFTSTSCLAQEEASEIQEFDVVEASEDENEEENLPRKENIGTDGGVGGGGGADAVKLPELTVKEKKELASYAHSLGKKLKLQLVGKSGVTQSLVSAFIENLESNELLKEASEIQEFDVVEASEDENEENLPKKENIGTGGGVGGGSGCGGAETAKLPELTEEEKKELASYAHSLGKKLKLQLVGKSGVTHSLISAFIENLESNELLKIKIHGTCPGELEDVVKQLEEGTGAVVVGQIGRTIIVYRPSVTKLQAEEKKRQARRIFVRKQSKVKHLLLERLQNKEQGMQPLLRAALVLTYGSLALLKYGLACFSLRASVCVNTHSGIRGGMFDFQLKLMGIVRDLSLAKEI
ncbi:hypothetical protein EZV62_011617 [Acer yangbiense]|uniref:CRM domain-containing protein n=1 Tax=Acer yangbiense TaxID=1000413 RepID=A0A5C7I516_9ROSI|nr:hypothetical protein EZV62_011617 [Acer yangbiense]